MFTLFFLAGALSSSEEIIVFLIGEVDVVEAMGVRELGWVIPVVLPG